MGHDGKDLGEYDALGVYAYSFDGTLKTWTRAEITSGGRVGFGLDPKAVDLDADGDVDLIAPGRSGLYWIENLAGETGLQEGQRGDKQETTGIADHTKVMEYADDGGEIKPVASPADWARRRAQIIAGMQQAMGELPDPPRRAPLDVEIIEETKKEKYTLRKVLYTPEPGDRAPAYLLLPHSLTAKAPAMLCLHQTTGIGKGEPAGLGGLDSLHYAHELAERGFVCLAPDYPSFGDYEYDFEKNSTAQGGPYASGTMKAIWNNIRAVDLLESLPEVDADRIGCIGHSLGGHNAMFTAAFDQRLKAVVSSCGFNGFHHYYKGDLSGWTSDRYMPRIRELYGNDPDRVPFDFHEIVAAIAPRAFFTNSPLSDDNFEVEGVRQAVDEAQKVYDLLGAKGKLRAVYPDAGHDFPEEIRRDAYEWLARQLGE
jgi:acetyl esterase/lipase